MGDRVKATGAHHVNSVHMVPLEVCERSVAEGELCPAGIIPKFSREASGTGAMEPHSCSLLQPWSHTPWRG